MKTRDEMTASERMEYNALIIEIEYWRERDNFILFELDNPPELQEQRLEFLDNMRLAYEKLQLMRAAS